jgi:hypothetical protein
MIFLKTFWKFLGVVSDFIDENLDKIVTLIILLCFVLLVVVIILVVLGVIPVSHNYVNGSGDTKICIRVNSITSICE